MRRKRPKFELLHLTVQTQGIVGIVTAVVAAGCGALAASPAGNVMAWLGAILAFLVTLVALFVYWHRSLATYVQQFVHSTPRRATGLTSPSDGRVHDCSPSAR
jgi:ABC-type nickel/cobalt efflux system permease component RcnA